MCGVLHRAGDGLSRQRGSSPRVRGFALAGLRVAQVARFIPACAGFCCTSPVREAGSGVHPRVCGVLKQQAAGLQQLPGSSPRVRGFALPLGKRNMVNGFIPACAGFCPSSPAVRAPSRVHPRVCGVLAGRWARSRCGKGSSPRVRGFVCPASHRILRKRFIPACAGFWRKGKSKCRTKKVHPRVCGVLARPRSSPAGSTGSSPRVRGFVARLRKMRQGHRFIPACAGFCLPVVRY